jgi:hypothetical protein
MAGIEFHSEPFYEQEKDKGTGSFLEEAAKRERVDHYIDPDLLSLINNLKVLRDPKSGEKEKTKARERLPHCWEKLMEAQLDQHEHLLETFFLRMRSAHPYDSRREDAWFGNARETLLRTRRENWTDDVEVKAWLDRAFLDITWGENNFRLLEGLGTVLPLFFDAEKMLKWVQTGPRSDPVASFYQQTFKKEVPGVSLTEEEKKHLPEGLKEGLRERAIKFQDDCTFWRMAVAAVNQLTYDQEGNPKTFVALTPKEIEFIQLLFGEKDKSEWLKYQGHEFPKSILNWYTMGSVEEKKRRYLATMEYLLTAGIRDKLRSEEVDLTKEVQRARERIEERLDNWFLPDISLKQRLAGVVARSGIVFDWGHMSAGQLGWGFEYEKNKVTGETTREVTTGATTVATDIPAAALWRLDECGTQKKGWPEGMLPPMSEEFKKRLTENPPDWKPRYLERIAKEDKKLQAALDRLWADEKDFKWDPQIKKYLEDMLWYWETPYKDEKGRPIVMPMFFPPIFTSLNFWETVTLEEGRKVQDKLREDGTIEKGYSSVWEQLAKGEKKMSEFEWEKMGDQAFYRWMITIGQVVRIWTVMVKAENAANEGQFRDFFASPNNLKELLKRANLATRDEKKLMPVLTAALAPMLVVLRTADEYGIIGQAGRDFDRRSAWVGELAKWLVAFSYQPEERSKIEQYNRMMEKFCVFYTTVIGRLGSVAGEEERREGTKKYGVLQKSLKKTTGLDVSTTQAIDLKPPERRSR